MINILNEEVKIKSDRKLKDAIHDIVVELEEDQFWDLGSISDILREEYGLFVTPKLLERLFTLWDNDKSTGVFNKSDESWLSWDGDEKIIENNLKKKKRNSVLGKSRRRIRKEEEKQKFDDIKKSGWIKLRDGRFVYKGPKTFKIEEEDKVSISKYEKESYGDKENPIVPELIRNIYVLDHPNDAEEISDEIQKLIDGGKIKPKPKDGANYYYETFRMMFEIGKKLNLDTKRGWEKKYAPVKLKESQLRKKKRENWEKQQEEEALKTVITDKNLEESKTELNTIIDTNKKYFILVTKFNTQKKEFYIKKILLGYLSISKYKFDDGFYKIVCKVNKDDDSGPIYFNTMGHFKNCIEHGIKGDGHIFNILKMEDIEKLTIYVKELKKFKGWDEWLDIETTNRLKNDF